MHAAKEEQQTGGTSESPFGGVAADNPWWLESPLAPAGHGWPLVLTQTLREDSRTATSIPRAVGLGAAF